MRAPTFLLCAIVACAAPRRPRAPAIVPLVHCPPAATARDVGIEATWEPVGSRALRLRLRSVQGAPVALRSIAVHLCPAACGHESVTCFRGPSRGHVVVEPDRTTTIEVPLPPAPGTCTIWVPAVVLAATGEAVACEDGPPWCEPGA